MAAIGAVTQDGARISITDEMVDGLRKGFRGELITSHDDGYETARRVWNGNVDRRPALIARCAGVADVQQARRLRARRTASCVSVRGGGHSAPGYGTNDGGLVIDLSPMKGIRVDPDRPHGAGAGRRALARARPRDPGVRARHDRRHGLQHRHRRADARRRPGLADGQARPHRRQPALGRRGHRRRTVPHGQRDATTRICSGRCGAAAATSASSRRSSTGCTR